MIIRLIGFKDFKRGVKIHCKLYYNLSFSLWHVIYKSTEAGRSCQLLRNALVLSTQPRGWSPWQLVHQTYFEVVAVAASDREIIHCL